MAGAPGQPPVRGRLGQGVLTCNRLHHHTDTAYAAMRNGVSGAGWHTPARRKPGKDPTRTGGNTARPAPESAHHTGMSEYQDLPHHKGPVREPAGRVYPHRDAVCGAVNQATLMMRVPLGGPGGPWAEATRFLDHVPARPAQVHPPRLPLIRCAWRTIARTAQTPDPGRTGGSRSADYPTRGASCGIHSPRQS